MAAHTPSELVAVLLARKRKRLWFREQDVETPPGEFPPGWRAWFAAMPRREGAVTGATAASMASVLAARTPVPPPPRSRDLGRVQALRALLRPQWDATPADGRGERRFAALLSAVLHVLVVWLLFLIPYTPPGPPAPRGDDVVQVEFIGDGTPEDSGGGAPAADVPSEQPAPAQAASPAQPAPPVAAAAPPAPPSESPPPEPVPEPQPEAVARQPLQVTETPVPDTTFVLPPTTPRELRVDTPQPRPAASVQARPRDIPLVQAPTAPAVQRELAVAPPQVAVRPVERQVEAREIPTLIRPQAVAQIAPQPSESARIAAPAQQAQARDIPMTRAPAGEQRTAAPADGNARSATAARQGTSASSPASAAAGPRADTGSGQRPLSAGRGADAARAGAPPGTRRGDDWGDSDRNRPGGNPGQSGLFNADGSPRLPPGAAAAGGGFPPGSDNWTRDQLDRYGTWSTRPPIGYDPTRFDQYWIPSGSLLDEWVRRGVRSMAIPIPGTSKKINCVLSVLQLGGACGISDANLQDQEATARPPPDIPYKPELQDGGAGNP